MNLPGCKYIRCGSDHGRLTWNHINVNHGRKTTISRKIPDVNLTIGRSHGSDHGVLIAFGLSAATRVILSGHVHRGAPGDYLGRGARDARDASFDATLRRARRGAQRSARHVGFFTRWVRERWDGWEGSQELFLFVCGIR